MFAVERFATLSQNYISRGIASNFYAKLPFLAVLGALTLGNNNKTSLEIGRPGVGEILSAKLVSPAQRINLGTVNSYQARIQRFETNNSAWLSIYGSMPSVQNPTTSAHSQAMQASAKFMWAEVDTPIWIWHEDKIRAEQSSSSAEGQGIAMAQLIEEATEVAFQDHIKALNDGIWNGNPTSQSADLWDAPLGILQALDSTNVYGNVDRSTQTGFSALKYTSQFPIDVTKLIDDANLGTTSGDPGIRIYGKGVDFITCPVNIYAQFKNQILRTNGGVIVQNAIPQLAQLGVKEEVLQKDNVKIMYDPSVPANTVCAFTMDTWRLSFHPQRSMKVTKFVDLEDSTDPQPADRAFIKTRLMFSCDNPRLNKRYTNVSN